MPTHCQTVVQVVNSKQEYLGRDMQCIIERVGGAWAGLNGSYLPTLPYTSEANSKS